MRYEKVIVMPVYRRPGYTRAVLEGMKSCYGIEKYKIFIHAEPGFPEVIDAIDKISGLNKTLHINPMRLGCNRNVHASLDHGFKESDFVIILEDDVVPAKDFLEFMEWARDKYADDTDIMNVCGYNKETVDSSLFSTVYRTKWFTPWGWGTWQNRWTDMSAQWDHEGKRASWDTTVNHFTRGERSEVRPRLGRTQNIGAELGSWVPSKEWHTENQLNTFWAGSCNVSSNQIYIEKNDN
jgi:hypothetical protein